jgi:hypothetical protein
LCTVREEDDHQDDGYPKRAKAKAWAEDEESKKKNQASTASTLTRKTDVPKASSPSKASHPMTDTPPTFARKVAEARAKAKAWALEENKLASPSASTKRPPQVNEDSDDEDELMNDDEVLEEVEDTDIEEDALKEEEAKANLETQIQQVDIVNNTAKSYRETGASKPSSVTQ